VRITVWNEYYQEPKDPRVSAVYPDGIHRVLAEGFEAQFGSEAEVRTAVLADPEHGLTERVLAETDVLVWWAHLKHGEVSDEIVERIRLRVLGGMGLLILHSAIESKIAQALLGTTCRMSWWRHGGRELTWTVEPGHQIAQGVPNPLVIPDGEMYGEPLHVPTPDDLVFITAYEGGEVLRSGCGWKRGRGRIFFLATGHEEYPIYYRDDVRLVLANAARWAKSPTPVETVASKVPQLPEHWWESTEANA
jgi:trehalose utilization protein